MPLTPYTGTFGREELMHLLRRTMFGVSVADITLYDGMPLAQVVDALLTYNTNPDPPVKTYWLNDSNGNPDPNLIDPSVPFGTTWVNTPRDLSTVSFSGNRRRNSFRRWYAGQLIQQESNLREKMVLFWESFLVTEISVVSIPEPAYYLNQYFRDNSLGNFRSMMYDVTISPAMLRYLNGYLNIAAAPDENYARELMELFTLGEGSGYTEDDIQEAARVLTGWKVRTIDSTTGLLVIPFTEFNANQHDTADKQFSGFFGNTTITGQSGANAGADELNALLDMVFLKDEVSEHVCRELYRFFVHSEIDANVEQNVIAPLAQTFRNEANNPDQMKVVMTELLSSEAFYDNSIRACMLRSPLDFIVGNMRMFKQPLPDPNTQIEALYRLFDDTYDLAAYTGQDLADPPSVAGWPALHQFPQYDELWLDTATYAVRKLIYEVLSVIGFTTGNSYYEPASMQTQSLIDFVDFVQDLTDPSDPDILLEELLELMCAVPVSQTVRDQLKQNYLLFGQAQNYYWTLPFDEYVNNPNTTDPAALLVPNILAALMLDIQGAAEHHLM